MRLCVRFVLAFLGIPLILCLPATGLGQALYSYTDENGVRVFTNIPPKGSVRDLKVTGAVATDEKGAETLISLPSKAPKRAKDAGDALPAAPNTSIVSRFDPIIEKYANQFNLDPSLVRSMIATESAFNPKAVSNKGARGLMQLMPATATRLGVRNSFDPEENIRGGVKHMRSLLDTFNNDLYLSLAAYNAGENLVQRVGRIPNIKETHDYVRSVTRKYGKNEMAVQTAEPPRVPSTFRWVDAKGVLHLTNIPPVQRSDSDFPLMVGASESPQ
jgi:hypothetical protein